jgi:hypothetical protein
VTGLKHARYKDMVVFAIDMIIPFARPAFA